MKKIITVFVFVMLIAASGWAVEDEMEPSVVKSSSSNVVDGSDAQIPEADSSAAGQAEDETTTESTAIEEEQPEHGFGHKLLFYIPNRFLDIFDIVRLRVRVGPGVAFNARATKLLSVFFGGYSSIYVGLPGPRMKPVVKLPIGIENKAGVSVSLADGTLEGKRGPNYSPTEFGAGFMFLLGPDIGVDPIEILDLAAGFLFIDIRGDDL